MSARWVSRSATPTFRLRARTCSTAAGAYTLFGAGEPAAVVGGSGRARYGPLPTDALSLYPIGIRLVLTVKN